MSLAPIQDPYIDLSIQIESENLVGAHLDQHTKHYESEVEEEHLEINETTKLLESDMNRQLLINQKNYSSSDDDEEEEREEENRSNQIQVDNHFRDHIVQQPTGTIISSCLNIINTILGAGMLAMPSAISSVGLGLGILLIGFCASASAFGLYLLSRVAAQVGRKSSFFTCASITYPRAAIFFDLAIAVKCFGVSISYLVIIGKLIPGIIQGNWKSLDNTIWVNRETWITISMIILLPVCFLRRLDSLKYTSAFSLCAVVYLLFVVLGFYFMPLDSMKLPRFEDLIWIKFSTNILKNLPIFVFAFTCHQNIFSIHNELANNSTRQIDKVIGRSIGVSFTVYQTIGIIGYLTFGEGVTENIITMYSKYGHSWVLTGAQISIAFLVLFSYPLQCHPCRNSLHKVFPTRGIATSSEEMSTARFSLLTIAIMISSYLIAVLVTNLKTVLAFVGATGSTTICYILPAIPGSKRPLLQKLAMGMIIMGVLIMNISLGFIIFGDAASAF